MNMKTLKTILFAAVAAAGLAGTANAAMAEADRILTERTDFAIVRLYAAGVKDATAATNTDESAEIKIVGDVVIDRTSDADNNLVTLTWQYVAGTFSSPRIIAAAELSTNAFETVEMTEPMQIEWGDTVAFVATAKVPKEKYGAQAFFKIVGTPDAPVDDGQVFDIYSDGTDYTVDFIPSTADIAALIERNRHALAQHLAAYVSGTRFRVSVDGRSETRRQT